jgi:molecular chaperone GrpE (heat shock protein)
LPVDFDAAKASALLRSYADSVEDTLEEGGITAFVPEIGTPFDPRLHRRVGKAEGSDAEVGLIALVVRSGYMDIDLERPIALAEVHVYSATEIRPALGQLPNTSTATTEEELP